MRKKVLYYLIMALLGLTCCQPSPHDRRYEKADGYSHAADDAGFVHYKSRTLPLPQEQFKAVFADNVSPATQKVLEEIIEGMVHIKGGSFLLGNLFPERVSSFYLSRYELTQKQYATVMGTANAYYKHPDHPMENISWVDGNIFMDRLKELTGLPFRYPTEEEWEFAARGGNHSKDYLFIGSNKVDEVSNYVLTTEKESYMHTLPVGSLEPNELGLYDMGGNVWEFTENDWREDYRDKPDNSWKVLRGGSFRSEDTRCKASSRSKTRANWRNSNIGMRLAL